MVLLACELPPPLERPVGVFRGCPAGFSIICDIEFIILTPKEKQQDDEQLERDKYHDPLRYAASVEYRRDAKGTAAPGFCYLTSETDTRLHFFAGWRMKKRRDNGEDAPHAVVIPAFPDPETKKREIKLVETIYLQSTSNFSAEITEPERATSNPRTRHPLRSPSPSPDRFYCSGCQHYTKLLSNN